MEEFVQMSLKTYDVLKFNNEYLRRKLKEEQELHSEDVAQANEEIDDLAEKIRQYKQYILAVRCRFIEPNSYSLDYYLDINSWSYGIDYKDDLLKLGITKQEMDEFISNDIKKQPKVGEWIPFKMAWMPLPKPYKEKENERKRNV